MLAPGVGVVARRELVEQFDVGHQPAAGVVPLDQIVTEDVVVGEGVADGGLEGVNVVDALAGEAAAAEQVLVDVRHRGRVRVKAGRPGQDAREQRARRGEQVEADPRLQHPVAGDDATLRRVEGRPVERVGQGGDQPARRLARQPSVGVEGDDEANPRQPTQVAAPDGIGGVGRAAQQAVELAELAALPLPAHPAPFRRVPDAAAVEEVEAVGAALGVALVQGADAVQGVADQRVVTGPGFGGGVGEVGQQRESQLRIRIREVMDLQMVHQFGGAVRAGQQRRHDDEGGAIFRYALLEVHPGQHARRQQQGEGVVDQADRDLADGQQGGGRGEGQNPRRGAGRPGVGQHAGEEQAGHREEAAEVDGIGPPAQGGDEGGAEPRPVAEDRLQLRPAGADQVIADVAPQLPLTPAPLPLGERGWG